MTVAGNETAGEAASCGTYAGAQRHKKRGEEPCRPCKDAVPEYMRDYRERKGPGADRWWNSTRGAALERLAAEYPDRFRALLTEVRAESTPTPWDSGDPS